ncbi:ATP-binding protein [Syntrophobotulus glycolicus]|nr:ATP-binding protein [Syntrophobotulus glycolicus]
MKSIVAKLWLTIIVLMIVVLSLLGFGLFELGKNFYYAQVTDNLNDQGRQIAGLYAENPEIFMNNDEINRFSQILNAHTIILNEKGIIQYCNAETHLFPGTVFQESELSRIFQGEEISKIGYYEHFDTQMLAIGLPVIREKQVVEAMFIYTPVAPISATLDSFRNLIAGALLASILIASVLALFLSRSLPKPLLRMNEVALSLAKGDYDQRVTVQSRDEMGVLGTSLNYLSEQLKKNMTELSYEKEKIENILIGMSDGVITVDIEGRVVLINPQAKHLLNMSNLEKNSRIDKDENLARLSSLFSGVLAQKEQAKEEIMINEKNLTVRLSPLFDPSQLILTGVIAVLQDTTREYKLEQMRRDFVANVSHELRTPISLIQGYAEALADHVEDSPVQQDQFMKIIIEESNRLKRLVEDLLELSRLQSGKADLEKEEINLFQVSEQVKEKYDQLFIQRNIKFKAEINQDAGTVWADKFMFEQIVLNLIDNAICYAPGGTITLTSARTQKGIELCLSDTGKGISEEDLPYLFERFYRADKSRNRESGGTGLGLSIVKNLVQAHGGIISVESEAGKGTKFSLKFPFQDK